MESVLTTPRRTETTPIERSAYSGRGLSATAIRFDCMVSPEVDVIGMEFADPANFGSTSPLSADDEAVLAGIAERLRAHGKDERFGVRLIRNSSGDSNCSGSRLAAVQSDLPCLL